MNTRARGVAISAIGFLSLAIGWWMVSMSGAEWYTGMHGAAAGAILFPLSIVLLVMGILAFVQDRGLDGVAFFGGAAVLGGLATYIGSVSSTAVNSASTNAVRSAEPLSYVGWIACMFAIYFACTWVGSLRSGATRSLFLLGTCLALGCAAIAGWAGVGGWMIAAGYLGLISSVLAFATAGSEIARYGRIANPNVDEARTVRPMAAD